MNAYFSNKYRKTIIYFVINRFDLFCDNTSSLDRNVQYKEPSRDLTLHFLFQFL